MFNFPLIVVGTYEEFVLGYCPDDVDEESDKLKLQHSFASHSHQASIRCVASRNHVVASAGADEYINIYDMFDMEVSTVINYHNATVTCLEFTPQFTHLVTANQNGDIAIFRCKDWTLVKVWKEAHKHPNGVTSLSVHPSGCLLLSTGADNIVRFWNLVKGRQAYAVNFSKKCSVGNSLNFGLWSQSGYYYGLCIGNRMEVYKVLTASITYEIKTNSKIVCSVFAKKTLICVGTEDGTIEIHSITKKKLLYRNQAHKARVKGVTFFTGGTIKDDKCVPKSFFVTVDSSGVIKLWSFMKKGLNCSLFLRAETDCGCRITSLTTVYIYGILGNVDKNSASVSANEVSEVATKSNEANSEVKSVKQELSPTDIHLERLLRKILKKKATASKIKSQKRKNKTLLTKRKQSNRNRASNTQ